MNSSLAKFSTTPGTNAELSIALVGNPNTGKSTLFNALAGMNQRVGNYPGVTVEQKIGRAKFGNKSVTIIDLPGTYSLSPKSLDELVALEVLMGRRASEHAPQFVVCVVDANNLERNLFLCSQLLEMRLPFVIALNMVDVAKRNGVEINVPLLAKRLGVPVIPIQANRKLGLDGLRQEILDQQHQTTESTSVIADAMLKAVTPVQEYLVEHGKTPHAEFFALRLVFDTTDIVLESLKNTELTQLVHSARDLLRKENRSLAAVESIARYAWIENKLEGVVVRKARTQFSWGDRLDRIATHRVWGTMIFVGLMVLMFQAIFAWAGPLMDLIEAGLAGLGDILTSSLPAGMLKSLIVDGIVAGVGGVLVFLPQICILFFFIAMLEDCGYMARAAFLMDKLMSKIGLSGKSFIPLLSSFACAIPGVMSTRVIENRQDRLITMLIAPLMSCSARIPVYVLLIAAFIPDTRYMGGWFGLQGFTMFAMYFLGIVVAVGVALLLRKTLLQGPTPPFVMELPEYKFPSLSNALRRMAEQGWAFVRRAGTLIFCVAIVVWALAYFPRNPEVEEQVRAQFAAQLAQLQVEVDAEQVSADAIEELEEEIANAVSSAYLQRSFLGRMGKTIEPVVLPLGWDWKIAAATIASFPAREVIVGTLGVIYSVGSEAEDQPRLLAERLQEVTWDGSERKVFNVPVALSIMVFFALCAQCFSTLVVIWKESGSWKWPLLTFVYMTTLAYLGALVTYQVATWFTS
ncbi:MAG TPA: ferrous iron transport protein B [Pirellulaceae bacterium]|nr:ferrous iron transport protein B [Pirellulaceae bacterium]HMO92018.1 ferrous iron transport protein B [Pirellulaceae bacterium]HMP68817.1 ferrous iron transport protein B [Pirellulaceae bacterium]